MSNSLSKQAHERVIERVMKRTGYSKEVCNFLSFAMWEAIAYYIQRPWLIVPKLLIGGFLLFEIMLKPVAFDALRGLSFGVADTMDKYLVKMKYKKYITLRNWIVETFKHEYEKQESSEGSNSDGCSNG
jgi:hypothetical protein